MSTDYTVSAYCLYLPQKHPRLVILDFKKVQELRESYITSRAIFHVCGLSFFLGHLQN